MGLANVQDHSSRPKIDPPPPPPMSISDKSRFSSAYILITVTPYTPLPYLDFILHLCVFTPYSHHHFITATIYYMVFTPPPPTPFCFFHLDYVSFYCTLSDMFLPISVSPEPFQLYLTLSFYCLSVQLVFYHPPITSLHLISAIFKIFFPHHQT